MIPPPTTLLGMQARGTVGAFDDEEEQEATRNEMEAVRLQGVEERLRNWNTSLIERENEHENDATHDQTDQLRWEQRQGAARRAGSRHR